MGFISTKIAGNGTAQVAVTNGATLDAVVNSLVAHNTTGGALTFSLLIDDSVVFTESVAANATFRIPDKVNLSASSVLKINAATGVNVTVSYLQQAIDEAGALNAAQVLAQAASDDADRAEAALGTNSNPVITGSITEQIAVCNLALEPDNGTVQTYTAAGDVTFTDGLSNGQFLTLILTNGGFTMTFPTITWWNAEPTLGTTDKLVFEKIGGVLYGCQVGTIA